MNNPGNSKGSDQNQENGFSHAGYLFWLIIQFLTQPKVEKKISFG